MVVADFLSRKNDTYSTICVCNLRISLTPPHHVLCKVALDYICIIIRKIKATIIKGWVCEWTYMVADILCETHKKSDNQKIIAVR